VLRISKLTDYGTVVMAHMASAPERVYTASAVASEVHVALPTISKILKALAHEGLLVSHRGAKGGYALARPPEAISIAEVIDALEGPIAVTECSSGPGVCTQENLCTLRANWQVINHAIRRALEGVTLADMAHPMLYPRVDISALQASRRVRTSELDT
jgi:FeS assembly SUF system regulator, gammaproteobacterial